MYNFIWLIFGLTQNLQMNLHFIIYKQWLIGFSTSGLGSCKWGGNRHVIFWFFWKKKFQNFHCWHMCKNDVKVRELRKGCQKGEIVVDLFTVKYFPSFVKYTFQQSRRWKNQIFFLPQLWWGLDFISSSVFYICHIHMLVVSGGGTNKEPVWMWEPIRNNFQWWKLPKGEANEFSWLQGDQKGREANFPPKIEGGNWPWRTLWVSR